MWLRDKIENRAKDHMPIIRQYGKLYGVSVELIKAIITVVYAYAKYNSNNKWPIFRVFPNDGFFLFQTSRKISNETSQKHKIQMQL